MATTVTGGAVPLRTCPTSIRLAFLGRLPTEVPRQRPTGRADPPPGRRGQGGAPQTQGAR